MLCVYIVNAFDVIQHTYRASVLCVDENVYNFVFIPKERMSFSVLSHTNKLGAESIENQNSWKLCNSISHW